GALGGALQAHVDRELDRVPGTGLAAELDRALRAAERVYEDLCSARLAAQEAVEHRLDARLADLVAGPVVLAGEALQLLGRDLPDVAEQLRRERLVGVVAQVGGLDAHAGEVAAVLLQVAHLVHRYAGLDRDRVGQLAAVLVHLAREVGGGHAEHPGETLDLAVAPLPAQVAHPQPDGAPGPVVDEDAAVAVEDGAPRRLDPDRAQLVVLRRRQVVVAREDLQGVEPEEQRPEDDERDGAEDTDPDGEARRQPVGLVRLRVGRQEAPRGRSPLAVGGARARQRAPPPSPALPAPAAAAGAGT